MISDEILIRDFAVFSDLGTDPPVLIEQGDKRALFFVRDGEDIELELLSDGKLTERRGRAERKFSDIRSLLASPEYADLGRWADNQCALLATRVKSEDIPIRGTVSSGVETSAIETLNQSLSNSRNFDNNSISILLLDGPAGIGKTALIRALAYERANDYRIKRKPLLLHVESRGRVLQNIVDLMAFSLQSLRASATYDQIPILVKYGLISIAIDGFDELGDPNGYELAWAQVNDIVNRSRGKGAILLSGRETFIGRQRLVAALTSVNLANDEVQAFTLQPLEANVARHWLSTKGWSTDLLQAETVQPLFERSSYALRPFFLSLLARDEVRDKIASEKIDDLLHFLVWSMVERESDKFGADVNAVSSSQDRAKFIVELMEEVARDLAENQSESISGQHLLWIAEVAAQTTVPQSLIGVLKNRANVIAFLTEDDRRGYRRFLHAKLQNYFLSRVTLRATIDLEIPKYIRRNILGLDFLQDFAEVARKFDSDSVSKFQQICISQMNALPSNDRSRQNLASLFLATAHLYEGGAEAIIKDVSIDEAYMTETVSKIKLQNVAISQLKALDADISGINCGDDCHIICLIAGEGTILPANFPFPNVLETVTGTITDPHEIGDIVFGWLVKNKKIKFESSASSHSFLQKGYFALLSRLARYKPYWLRGGEDRSGKRILEDPHWDELRPIMLKHDLLVERFDVPAAGRRSPFYHVRNRQALLDLWDPPRSLYPFLTEVVDLHIKHIEEKNKSD